MSDETLTEASVSKHSDTNNLSPTPEREGLINLPPFSWEQGIRGGEAKKSIY